MDEQWRREVIDLHRRALEERLRQRALLNPQQVASLLRSERDGRTYLRPPVPRTALDGDAPEPGWCDVVSRP